MQLFYKVMSSFLSVVLVFTSLVPSFAQIRNTARSYNQSAYTAPTESTRTAFSAQVERRMLVKAQEEMAKPVSNEQGIALHEMQKILFGANLSQSEQVQENVDLKMLFPEEEFVRFYKEINQKVLDEALAKCTTQEERAYVQEQWEQRTSKEALTNKYNQALGVLQQEINQEEKETKAHLRYLSEQAVTLLGDSFKVNGQIIDIDPVAQFLPLMVPFGEEVLPKMVRAKATSILRQRLQTSAVQACKDEMSCKHMLQNAAALAVLGTQQKDVETVAKVFKANYNGPAAASVISVIGPMLLAMNDVDPQYKAFTDMMTHIARQEEKVNYWDVVGGALSLQSQLTAAHYMGEGTFALGYENSFYKADNKYKNLYNAWIDFGQAVAQESVANKTLKNEVNNLLSEQLIGLQKAPKGHQQVVIKHPLFVTGLLSAGYQLNVKGRHAQTYLDAQGKAHQTTDTRSDWTAFNQQLQKANLTQSEGIALMLFKAGKANIDPYTAVYIDNQLAGAYKRSERAAQSVGMQKRTRPSAQEISSYKNWQAAQGVAGALDMVITVASMVVLVKAILTTLPKIAGSGAQTVRNIMKAARIARSAQTAQVARLSSMQKVLRAARYYKYGTYSRGSIFLQNARTSLGASLGYRINMNDLMPKKAPYVRPTTAVRTVTPAKVIPLDSKTVQVVPQGSTVGQGINIGRTSPAPETFASQGAPVANTAKVQPLTVAQQAPTVQPTANVLTGNTPYVRGKVTNALGQEVEAWVPNPDYAASSAPVSPVRKFSWWDNIRLQWDLSIKPAFNNLFRFSTSRYGLAAMVPGAAPISSEVGITQALLKDMPAIVRPIQVERSMFISENALRIGSLGSKMEASNLGGMASQRFAQTASVVNPGIAKYTPQIALKPLYAPGAGAVAIRIPRKVAAPRSSGILYSSLFPIPSAVTNWFLGKFQSDDKQATDILNQVAPLATQLVSILKTSTSIELKQQALVRLYKMGKLTKILQRRLTPEAMQAVVNLGREEDTDLLAQRLYAFYDAKLISEDVNKITDTPQQGALLKELADVVSAPGFASQSRALWEATNKIPVMSVEDIGTTSFVPEADLESVYSAFRTEPDFVAKHVVAQDKGSWLHYDNHIPFYYRDSQGRLSEEPVGILTQNRPGRYGKFLSRIPLYFKGPKLSKPSTWFRKDSWKLSYMADKAGLDIPKGFVLALDENGQWKFVKQNRALAESNPISQKLLKNIEKRGSMQVGLETPYSTADLLAVAKMLEKKTQAQRVGKLNFPLSFELALNSADSFKQMLKVWGFYVGLDTGASLSGPFKDAAKGLKGAPINAVSNGVGGLGYFSPIVAALTSNWMRKWGLKASMFGLFGSAGVGLGYSLFGLGMTGFDDPEELGLSAQTIPFVTAIFTGSLFGVLQPLVLNHYKNPVARTAANLEFASTKQKARMLLTLATFAFGLQKLGDLEWTLAIPLAFGLLGVSFLLFLNTPLVRSATPSLASANSSAVKNLLASVNKQPKTEITSEQKAAEAKEFAKDYEKTFSKLPAIRAIRDRVANVYAGYAPLMAIVSQVVNAEGTLPLISGEKIGQLVMVAFMFSAYKMREWSKVAVKSNRYTDDQLTGLSLPILAATSAIIMFMPFNSIYALATAAVVAALYVGTAVPGQLDNTRMQNIVSEVMQARKQAVQNNNHLSKQEKEEQLEKLDREEKDWSFRATRDYSYYNGVGLAGVLAATGLAYWLGDKHGADNFLNSIQIYNEDLIFTMDRLIFGLSSIVLGALAWRHRDLTVDYWRARHPIQITEENIQAGHVNAAAFGISARNIGENLGKLNKTLKDLQKLSIEYGLSSEQKMTDMLNKMVVVYNRLLAIKEAKGGMDTGLQGNFDVLLKLAQNYQKALEYNNLSVMLNREFERFRLALSKNGELQELSPTMTYIEEGTYALPKDYTKYVEAKDLIQKDLFQLAHRILNGTDVDARTYRLFIEYQNRAMADLQQYTAENVADSKRALDLKRELTGICSALKRADDMSGILDTNAGPTSKKDIQALRDMLAGFPYEGENWR